MEDVMVVRAVTVRKPLITFIFSCVLLLNVAALASDDLTIPDLQPEQSSEAPTISCPDSKHDLEHKPVSRFTDNRDGTISDNYTNFVWLKNASCSDELNGIKNPYGKLNWHDAVNWTRKLASGTCRLRDGSCAGDWHLPTHADIDSLISGPCVPELVFGFNWKYTSNGIRPQDWLVAQGFESFRDGYYWAKADQNIEVWRVYKRYGYVNDYNFEEANESYLFNEDNELYLLPVSKREAALVAGYVKDADTFAPIENVIIIIDKISTNTNIDGKFEIRVQFLNKHTVKLVKEGYEDLVNKSVSNYCHNDNIMIFNVKRLPPPKDPQATAK